MQVRACRAGHAVDVAGAFLYSGRMPGKASHPQKDNMLQWLFERGEEAVAQVAEELLGRKDVARGASHAAAGAAKAKGRLDKNIETLLHLLNVPSRTDFDKLLVKVEHLQGSVVNLSLKLDRLLAALDAAKKSAPARPRR